MTDSQKPQIPTILLNPGPVSLSERVRHALQSPDICHREPEFFELQRSVRKQLLGVYELAADEWGVALLSGSGTAAVEMMLSSLVRRDGRVLVIENGVYGERISKIAEAHCIPYSPLHFGWGETVALERLTSALAADTSISHVAVVHHETTTGLLNSLPKIGEVCRARGTALLVDAVSSFGAEEIDFSGWGVTACAVSANKCLHGIPGLAFVVAQRSAFEQALQPPRTVYLDLRNYFEKQERDDSPFTPAVQSFYALDEALRELAEAGGWRARQRRYRFIAERVRDCLVEIGVEPVIPDQLSSCVLRSYHLPEGLPYEIVHDRLKQLGFVIYAGQGQLNTQLFRISTMGAIADEVVDRLLSALRECFGGNQSRRKITDTHDKTVGKSSPAEL